MSSRHSLAQRYYNSLLDAIRLGAHDKGFCPGGLVDVLGAGGLPRSYSWMRSQYGIKSMSFDDSLAGMFLWIYHLHCCRHDFDAARACDIVKHSIQVIEKRCVDERELKWPSASQPGSIYACFLEHGPVLLAKLLQITVDATETFLTLYPNEPCFCNQMVVEEHVPTPPTFLLLDLHELLTLPSSLLAFSKFPLRTCDEHHNVSRTRLARYRITQHTFEMSLVGLFLALCDPTTPADESIAVRHAIEITICGLEEYQSYWWMHNIDSYSHGCRDALALRKALQYVDTRHHEPEVFVRRPRRLTLNEEQALNDQFEKELRLSKAASHTVYVAEID